LARVATPGTCYGASRTETVMMAMNIGTTEIVRAD